MPKSVTFTDAGVLADQVGRLDVAVHDAFAVRVDERFEQALRGADGVGDRQRAALGEQDVDRRPFHELHHQHGADRRC